jgi:cyclic pyranopterin phosphate synthase
MQDSFGRRVDYLRISVSDRCNLRCIYCIPRGIPSCAESSEVLGREPLLRLIRIALRHGLRKVRLTGGEPLLRHDIVGLVGDIKETGVKDLSLTTNGILLAEKAGELKQAGLDRVNVSLDSMHPERYRAITGGGRIEEALAGIHEAERAGLTPVKINMIPIRGVNEDEVAAFAALSLANPRHVRFIELMPVGEGAWNMERLVDTDEVMEKIASAFGCLMPVEEAGSSRNYRLPGAEGVIGFISPVSNHFCHSCNRLRITARGKLRPCLFSDLEIDLKEAGSDEEMERLFLCSVRSKPEGRRSGAPLPLEAMSQIGG